jgi:hypothetical protein
MKHTHTLSPQFSYAMLFDPALALAAAERAAHWDLPRRVCRPLDHYIGPRVSADVAAYDATVEMAPVSGEEMLEELPGADDRNAAGIEQDSDLENGDD